MYLCECKCAHVLVCVCIGVVSLLYLFVFGIELACVCVRVHARVGVCVYRCVLEIFSQQMYGRDVMYVYYYLCDSVPSTGI